MFRPRQSSEERVRPSLFDIDEEASHPGDLSVDSDSVPSVHSPFGPNATQGEGCIPIVVSQGDNWGHIVGPRADEQARSHQDSWGHTVARDDEQPGLRQYEQQAAAQLSRRLRDTEAFLHAESDLGGDTELQELRARCPFLRVCSKPAYGGAPAKDVDLCAPEDVAEEVLAVQYDDEGAAWSEPARFCASPRQQQVQQAILVHLWRQLIPAFVPVLRAALVSEPPPSRVRTQEGRRRSVVVDDVPGSAGRRRATHTPNTREGRVGTPKLPSLARSDGKRVQTAEARVIRRQPAPLEAPLNYAGPEVGSDGRRLPPLGSAAWTNGGWNARTYRRTATTAPSRPGSQGCTSLNQETTRVSTPTKGGPKVKSMFPRTSRATTPTSQWPPRVPGAMDAPAHGMSDPNATWPPRVPSAGSARPESREVGSASRNRGEQHVHNVPFDGYGGHGLTQSVGSFGVWPPRVPDDRTAPRLSARGASGGHGGQRPESRDATREWLRSAGTVTWDRPESRGWLERPDTRGRESGRPDTREAARLDSRGSQRPDTRGRDRPSASRGASRGQPRQAQLAVQL